MKVSNINVECEEKLTLFKQHELKTLISKLVLAYEKRDFSIITLYELFQLVDQGYLHPNTASKLAGGCNYVS